MTLEQKAEPPMNSETPTKKYRVIEVELNNGTKFYHVDKKKWFGWDRICDPQPLSASIFSDPPDKEFPDKGAALAWIVRTVECEKRSKGYSVKSERVVGNE